MTDRVSITLAGMRFHARVGVLTHERDLPQPLEVDLTVWRVPHARTLLDYRELYAAVAEVLGREPIRFLEDVADEVATRVLALRGASRVRVTVRKPHVMLPGPLHHAEVVLERDALAEAADAGG